jgi:hypothetical protein
MVKRLLGRLSLGLVVPILLVVGVIALAGWFFKYNQTPAVGVVIPPAVPAQTQGVASTKFKSSSISFEYPAHYSLENKEVAASVVELYGLSMRGATESRRIGITVKRSQPGETVFDDSAYKFRSMSTKDYQVSDAIVAGKSAKKMTKKDNSEITYFIPGNRYYVMFAATSTNPSAAFADEITGIIKSFAWVR